MKIIVKIEDGAPILFFPSEPANPGRVLCYAQIGEHSEAGRAYMRKLPEPATPAQRREAWRALARYSQSSAEHEA